MAEAATGDTSLVRVLVDFADELRRAGLTVGTGDVVTYGAAMEPLDPTDLSDLYWGGRVTLVTRHDQLPVYDRVFRHFFLGDGGDEVGFVKQPVVADRLATLEIPETDPPQGGSEKEEDREVRLGLVSSDIDLLRNKSFSACTAEELAAVRRMITRIELTPPRRRTRRTAPGVSGRRPDMRRSIRETMRQHGEPSQLFWRRRRRRMRPLVLILDVSGSMSDYSRNLLQFAYSARRADRRVEVFCFGTRLTRITRSLERRKPDDAMADAAEAVFDWEGGTRIGDSLETFVSHWGRRGTSRGGVVVICSDGLDRGEPQVLAQAMERLARLSHRVVWMNPHRGDDADFRPTTLGMMVAAPHVDEVVSGHDLRSLEDFAARLPEFG